jgi:CRISPR-associated exonuclease Cas4
MSFAENDEPIAISALQHVSYCPRQYALIHLEQEFEDNVHTMRGHVAHERVDEGLSGFLPSGVAVRRSLQLFSHRYGLVGKSDVVEFHPDGRVFPVEYKQGRRRAKRHDNIQLASQALCLEEMLTIPVDKGAIYHVSSHKRREVAIDSALRLHVEEAIDEINAIRGSGQLPPPVRDERCRDCSLIQLCQPELVNRAEQSAASAWRALFELDEDSEV